MTKHRLLVLLGAAAIALLLGGLGVAAFLTSRNASPPVGRADHALTPSPSESAAQVGEGSTPREAAATAAQRNLEPGTEFKIESVDQYGDWAWVSGILVQGGETISPEGVAVIAHLESGQWRVAAPGSDLGIAWMCQMPPEADPYNLRERYLGPVTCP